MAVCHGIGHVTSNVSFAAVAVSFAHTIKGASFLPIYISLWILLAPVLFAHVSMIHTCNAALEPFFSAAATQFILGQQVPFSLWLSLAPVVIGNSQFDPLILITSIFFTGLNNTYYLNCTFLSILIIGYKLIRHTLLAHPL